MSKPKLTTKERGGEKICTLCNNEIETKHHNYSEFQPRGWANLKKLAAKWATKKIELEHPDHKLLTSFKSVHSRIVGHEQAF